MLHSFADCNSNDVVWLDGGSKMLRTHDQKHIWCTITGKKPILQRHKV